MADEVKAVNTTKLEGSLYNIGDAIRRKTGDGSLFYSSNEMVQAIDSIKKGKPEQGGSTGVLTKNVNQTYYPPSGFVFNQFTVTTDIQGGYIPLGYEFFYKGTAKMASSPYQSKEFLIDVPNSDDGGVYLLMIKSIDSPITAPPGYSENLVNIFGALVTTTAYSNYGMTLNYGGYSSFAYSKKTTGGIELSTVDQYIWWGNYEYMVYRKTTT